MRSFWMIRIFAYAFMGCLLVYFIDPASISMPGASNKETPTTGDGGNLTRTRSSTLNREDKVTGESMIENVLVGEKDQRETVNSFTTAELKTSRIGANTGTSTEPTGTRDSSKISVSESSPKQAQISSANRNKENGLPPDLRLCRMTPAPVLGEERQRLWTKPGFENHTLKILRMEYFRYRCAGAPYNDFMEQHLFPYIRERYATNPQWGRRPSIVPQARSILVIGNSHTQQMVGALLCQYRDQIYKSRRLQESTYEVNAVEYRFISGLKIFVLSNHASVYSHRWKKNLEDVLGLPLRELDAIVLGQLNIYDPKDHDTAVWENFREYGREFPDYHVDMPQYAEGFNFTHMTEQYAGDILWVSMTADYNMFQHEKVLEEIKNIANTTGRTNLHAVNARQNSAGVGAECSSDSHAVVATCVTDPSNYAYSNGHKCMGDKGGEPDLVAYDVVEALHDIFAVRGGDESAA